MIKKLLYFALFANFLISCKQKDITPSWLKIDAFILSTNEATQGANTDGISDAWIYMDGNPIGVFELPCMVPIIDEGEHSFTIFAGIKNNGISDTRKRYPFYTSFKTTGTLVLNDTLELFPTITYKNNVQFSYLEDFEGAGISLVKGPSSDTDVVFITAAEHPDIVAYGDKCGGIFLDGTDSLYAGSTTSVMKLPRAEEVYLEVDFRNNNSLAMGMIAKFIDGTTREQNPLVIMNAQEPGEEVWKKIYIDLKENVSSELGAVSYEIFFLALFDDTHPIGSMFIDNLKVVHYQ